MESAELALKEWGALGRRITAVRQEKGWSRVELARKLRISRERLAKWEQGDNSPPLGLLVRLSRLLGVTLDELVTGERPADRSWTEEERKELAVCLDRLLRFLERL